MNKIITRLLICFFISAFISACDSLKKINSVENNQPESLIKGYAQVNILFSQEGINLVDAPLKIETLSIIDQYNVPTLLLENQSINPTNLSDLPQLVAQEKIIKEAIFTRLHVRLSFNPSSNIHFFHDMASEMQESEYVNAKGQVLGTESMTMDIYIPLNNKDGKRVKIGNAYGLQIHWNLNRLFNIHFSDDKTVVELKSGIEGFFVDENPISIALQGIIKNKKDNFFDINIDSNENLISVNYQGLKQSSTKNIKPGEWIYATTKADFNKKSKFKLTSYEVFSKEDRLYKGIIIEKNKTTSQVMATQFNHANYLGSKKTIYLVNNTDLRSPIERSKTLFIINEEKILRGEEQQDVEVNTLNSEEENHSIYYHTMSVSYNSDNKNVNKNQFFPVSAYIFNGFTYRPPETFTLTDLPSLDDGLYNVKATYDERCNDNITEIDCPAFTVEEITPIDKIEDYKLHWWDFNYLQESLAYYLEQETELTPVEKERRLQDNANTEILNFYDGSGIVIFSGAFDFYNGEEWVFCDRSIKWKPITIENNQPILTVELSENANTNNQPEESESVSEVFYFFTLNDFSTWFSQYEEVPLYLEELYVNGNLLESNDLGCQFETTAISMRLITDPTSRAYFKEAFLGGDFSITNRGMSAAAFGAIWAGIGVAGIGALGLVAIIIDKIKNNSDPLPIKKPKTKSILSNFFPDMVKNRIPKTDGTDIPYNKFTNPTFDNNNIGSGKKPSRFFGKRP